MIKVGIIGFGFMGNMHAQAYHALADVHITAIADIATQHAQEKVAQLGFEIPVFTDLTTLLAESDVDIIDICGPTDQHLELATQAIQAGKHLFIEKPLALTLEDCQAIQSATDAAGVFAQVGHCIRFWPEYMKLKQIVDSGTHGPLKSLSLTRRSPRPGGGNPLHWVNQVERCGGAVVDLHVHDTDFINHLLGMPQSVYSRTTEGSSGPDHIFSHYHYEHTTVQAEGGWDYPGNYGFSMSFEAIFEDACIQYNSASNTPLLLTTRGCAPVAIELDVTDTPTEATHSEGNISSLGGYFNEINYFINCVKNKQAPEIATLKQASNSIRILLAELKSAKNRQNVSI
ncbi:Gfo/Idh/MocA family oxidoreductase [Coraliomargarita sp. SDUM461004]|uniref:Gfo/Idh/MocA family oxidoreductase n=1 Tax=Thalassobacterium sedimentorum TaxID=3041258 RepID=A0ABU1ADZ9_9BACT|nr:Gfo/Idh/MocA family oxidoreductase [Coraliomargarita sp. SDUM461004]MDQ8192942.1 Gfo/Idh/MocA family oxidoreductase [Coraliomargarita sp. SDUM461004]